MGRDSVIGTLLVATVLCVACALVVSSTRVLLSERQEENKRLDRKKNILLAAGLIDEEAGREKIDAIFAERVRPVLIDLDKGEVVPPSEVDYDTYDPREILDDPEQSKEITVEGPTPGVQRRERLAFIYEVNENETIDLYVLPIYGKGLWSTMWGFLAIDSDGRTLRGITFYEHGETPGLGGEIDNQGWQAQWASGEDPGSQKYAYDQEGNVAIRIVKGNADPNSPNYQYQIDGLSGATITTRGLSTSIQYWLGPDGFGPYLKKVTGGETFEMAGIIFPSTL